jgi:phosphoribosylformylglycinamidine cyclo-ligase
MTSNTGITYADSGVDIEAGDRAVELMKESVKSTLGPNVLGGAGGFAGMYDISQTVGSMKKPVLCTSTDGVGTKVAIASAIDKHDTIGFDLVGMVVDDIAVTGATPLFMTDYICVGKVFPERIASIVSGVAAACKEARTALVGGETAEHPGLLGENEYDIAGAATGIIDAERILGPERVKVGDKIVALASSGLHSNGYSLVRNVFTNPVSGAGWTYDKQIPEFNNTILGEVLLEPTRIYSGICLDLSAKLDIHTFSHITGGGLASNIARVLPKGTVGLINRETWEMPAIFKLVQSVGNVPGLDLEQTLNMGIGMVAVLPDSDVDSAIEMSKNAGINAWVCGEVVTSANFDGEFVSGTKGVDGGGAVLIGDYIK